MGFSFEAVDMSAERTANPSMLELEKGGKPVSEYMS
jgi:hypothetical protein